MTTSTPTRPPHDSIHPTADAEHLAPVPRTAPRRRPRIELSATQLIATAFAAVTATFAASFLGVTGTVIGAALASVLTATGNAVYGASLRHTRDRVRAAVPPSSRRDAGMRADGRSRGPATASRAHAQSTNATSVRPLSRPLPGGRCRPGGRRLPELPSTAPRRGSDRVSRAPRSTWRAVALGSIAVFTGVLAVVTTVEVVAGRPLSDVVRGSGGSGTSLFGDAKVDQTKPAPVPTVTTTVTPAVKLVTPTVIQTAPAKTVTTTPTATVTNSPSSSDSGATSGSASAPASSSPSGSATPLP